MKIHIQKGASMKKNSRVLQLSLLIVLCLLAAEPMLADVPVGTTNIATWSGSFFWQTTGQPMAGVTLTMHAKIRYICVYPPSSGGGTFPGGAGTTPPADQYPSATISSTGAVTVVCTYVEYNGPYFDPTFGAYYVRGTFDHWIGPGWPNLTLTQTTPNFYFAQLTSWTQGSASVTLESVNRYLRAMYNSGVLPHGISGSWNSTPYYFSYTLTAGLPQIAFSSSNQKISLTYPFSGSANYFNSSTYQGYNGSVTGSIQIALQPAIKPYPNGSIKVGVDLSTISLGASLTIQSPASYAAQLQYTLNASDFKSKLFPGDSFFPVAEPIVTQSTSASVMQLVADTTVASPISIAQSQLTIYTRLGVAILSLPN
jgi:hypothetical protein